jgi:N-acetylglucosaminylphosphatidylinositol deacetylase
MAPPDPPFDAYLLVFAHPDDESMFFSPVLSALVDQQRRCASSLDTRVLCPSLHLLSLSSGNHDGLGETRKVELVRAAEALGVVGGGAWNSANTVTCLDQRGLLDGPAERWDADVVAGEIGRHIAAVLPPRATGIRGRRRVALLTFDEMGVSGHPNHADTCRGVRHFVSKEGLVSSLAPNSSLAVEAWELVSIANPLKKYIPFLEWIPMLVAHAWFCIATLVNDTAFMRSSILFGESDRSAGVSFQMFRPWLVWRAMAAHRSQFVWYRRLSVIFSRYTYGNILQAIPIDGEGTPKKKR